MPKDKLSKLLKLAANAAREEAEKHNKNATLIECISGNPDNYSFEEILDVCNTAKAYFGGCINCEYFEWFEQVMIAKLHCDVRVSLGNYCAETAHRKTYDIIIYCKNHRIVIVPNEFPTIWVKTYGHMNNLPLSDFTEVLNKLNADIEKMELHIPFYDDALKSEILRNTTITESQINPTILYPH